MSSSVKRNLLIHNDLLLHLHNVLECVFIQPIQLLNVVRIILTTWGYQEVTQIQIVVVLIVSSHLEKLFLSQRLLIMLSILVIILIECLLKDLAGLSIYLL